MVLDSPPHWFQALQTLFHFHQSLRCVHGISYRAILLLDTLIVLVGWKWWSQTWREPNPLDHQWPLHSSQWATCLSIFSPITWMNTNRPWHSSSAFVINFYKYALLSFSPLEHSSSLCAPNTLCMDVLDAWLIPPSLRLPIGKMTFENWTTRHLHRITPWFLLQIMTSISHECIIMQQTIWMSSLRDPLEQTCKVR